MHDHRFKSTHGHLNLNKTPDFVSGVQNQALHLPVPLQHLCPSQCHPPRSDPDDSDKCQNKYTVVCTYLRTSERSKTSGSYWNSEMSRTAVYTLIGMPFSLAIVYFFLPNLAAVPSLSVINTWDHLRDSPNSFGRFFCNPLKPAAFTLWSEATVAWIVIIYDIITIQVTAASDHSAPTTSRCGCT